MANQNMHQGVNHASGLPAMNNEALQILLGTRLSEFVIMQYRRTLPVQLFLEIDMSVDLCRSTTYLCENKTDLPQLNDSALDAVISRRTIQPPKTVTFVGFCKGGFETKLSKEQLECINQSDVLRQWYQTSLLQAVEDGKQALMARFYRHLMVHGVHGRNTGLNAGQLTGGHILGTPANPVKVTPDNVDVWMMELINVIKQMPRVTSVVQEFGASTENAFIFAHPALESVLMKAPDYNLWDRVGDCNSCNMFSDTFDRKPRGLMPVTSYCIDKRVCESGGKNMTSYPVLFGRRFAGTKAALRVETKNYDSLDGDSTFFRTTFYWHIHTYDCRNLGISWITLEDTKPETVSCE